MAKVGISRVNQIQYLQPCLMIIFAALFLHESISVFTIVIAIAVVLSVMIGKNASIAKKASI